MKATALEVQSSWTTAKVRATLRGRGDGERKCFFKLRCFCVAEKKKRGKRKGERRKGERRKREQGEGGKKEKRGWKEKEVG